MDGERDEIKLKDIRTHSNVCYKYGHIGHDHDDDDDDDDECTPTLVFS